MLTEIPLKTNLYNFTSLVSVNGRSYSLRFNYSPRKDSYLLDILDNEGNLLEAGLLCLTDVQLNKRIIDDMKGVLFFTSKDKSISLANAKSLGTSVRLVHFFPDNLT